MRNSRGNDSWAAEATLVAASSVLALALVECALHLALAHATLWPADGKIARLLRRLHQRAEWRMIQLEPECARYDRELGYTLRPGGCTIEDREFTVRYDVNRLGLRDDEASLDAPAVIVLGDSYAMGWGVERAQAFPELLETALGITVLDAGVPSYGTARELRLLQRLDRRGLQALVVQYCWNDNEENRSYLDHDGALPVMTAPGYQRAQNEYLRGLRYYPGKLLLTMLAMAWPGTSAVAGPPPGVEDAARDFLDVLARNVPVLGAVPVVVVSTCQHTRAFTRSASARLATPPYQALAPLVSFVDPSPLLRSGDRYPLDAHLTAGGHVLYARLLEVELRRRGLPTPDARESGTVLHGR